MHQTWYSIRGDSSKISPATDPQIAAEIKKGLRADGELKDYMHSNEILDDDDQEVEEEKDSWGEGGGGGDFERNKGKLKEGGGDEENWFQK